jgi:hypothetical protein
LEEIDLMSDVQDMLDQQADVVQEESFIEEDGENYWDKARSLDKIANRLRNSSFLRRYAASTGNPLPPGLDAYCTDAAAALLTQHALATERLLEGWEVYYADPVAATQSFPGQRYLVSALRLCCLLQHAFSSGFTFDAIVKVADGWVAQTIARITPDPRLPKQRRAVDLAERVRRSAVEVRILSLASHVACVENCKVWQETIAAQKPPAWQEYRDFLMVGLDAAHHLPSRFLEAEKHEAMIKVRRMDVYFEEQARIGRNKGKT